MALVVIGRHGTIGRRLLTRVAGTGAWSTTHRRGEPGPCLDLEHAETFDAARLSADDHVVIAAAMAAPDRCARDPQRARQVNVEGTVRVARAAAARGCHVVVFSSDTVYGDTPTTVDESTPPAPVGVYGELKREMERALSGFACVDVLRLSFVAHRDDSFLSYLAYCAARGATAEIFEPFDRAVVDIVDVVDCVLRLCDDEFRPTGMRIVNVGGPEVLSRVRMSELVREHLLPSLQIRVVHPSDDFYANRPKRIDMRSPSLPSILGRVPNDYASAIVREWRGADLSATNLR